MTRQRGKIKYAFGFDPSINDAAWAVVGTDGSVLCGLIRNPYAQKGPTDNWRKLEVMLHYLQQEIGKVVKSIPKLDAWVCEGQYCQRRGNQEHNVRLGWISSMVYTLGYKKADRLIAIPSKWTRNKPKELRHPELLEGLAPEEEWKWIGKPAPTSLLHNIYDAVGLALWGLAEVNETIEVKYEEAS